MLKQQTQVVDEGKRGEGVGRTEKYEAKNWKELTERQLNKLTPVERSRYMAVSCCSCPTHCDLGNANFTSC